MGEVVAQKVTASTAAAAEEEKQPAVVMDEQLPIHVLVVDDCFLDRRIVSKLLLKASFKVTTVDSGKKALEVLGIHAADADPVDESSSTLDKVEKIDLILTDFCMPEMNGHDLLVAVKVTNK
ncbi:Two-component response regulator ARR8 [Linum grandiflorum]